MTIEYPAQGGSNSPVDGIADDLAMHPLQQYPQLSKQTYRSVVNSGSNSSNQREYLSVVPSTETIHDGAELTGNLKSDRNEHNRENGIRTHKWGVSGLSGESHLSSQNSIDSRNNRPFSRQTTLSQNEVTTSKFKDIEQGRMELLRKVNELRYELIGSVTEQRSTTSNRTISHLRGSRYSRLVGIAESELELLDHHPHAQMRSRRRLQHQPPYMSSSGEFNSYCLHCQALTPREISCNNGLCMSCCRVHCPPPPPPPPPPPCSGGYHWHMVSNSHFSSKFNQNHDLLLPMNIPRKVKEQQQTIKHHCRPILGGANFIICYECLKLLQIPDGFHVSRSRTNKLRCGVCTEILTLSFPENNHSKSREFEVRDSFAGEFSSNMSSTFGGGNPIHVPMNSVDSEGENGRRMQHPAALHMLMGYYSASDILHQP